MYYYKYPLWLGGSLTATPYQNTDGVLLAASAGHVDSVHSVNCILESLNECPKMEILQKQKIHPPSWLEHGLRNDVLKK